jgi:A/G-specific adenine glycosylase
MCEAKRHGLQDQIPPRTPAPSTVQVRETAVVVRRGGQVLLVQRPDDARRWAKMWEFPHVELQEQEGHEAGADRCLWELVGMRAELGSEIVTIRHGVTRYAITMVCLEALHRAGEFQSGFYARGVWLSPAELATYPVSAPQRRLIAELTRPNRQHGLF